MGFEQLTYLKGPWLALLKLTCVKENCQPLAVENAANHWSHLDYLGRLLQGEVAARQQHTIARRIKAARFPVIKTLEGFRWDWPKKNQSAPAPGPLPA
jgi:DNA replication protein DnaC